MAVADTTQVHLDMGRRVRAVRVSQGISLRQLAAKLEVSPATLSAVETGQTGLSAIRLSRVAQLLDVPVTELLDLPARVGRLSSGPAGGRGSWRDFPDLALDPPLEGALDAFLELGYAGASMREIGRRAGLSVPGLYHHYATKQELLVALLDLTMGDVLSRCVSARADGRDAVERFRLLVEALALFHTHRGDLGFIGASEMRSLELSARVRVAAARTEIQRMVDDEVLEAHAQGSFATTWPREAARAVVTMCTALSQWYSVEGPFRSSQIADQYVGFALALVQHRPSATT